MISTQGLSTMLAITLIGRERETFETGIKNEATSKREIDAFRERIGSITSVKELQDDYELNSFVMKTFGLEAQIPYKAMNAKIMTSDITDSTSLVNKLTDSDFKQMNVDMGFGVDGSAPERFNDTIWVEGMVEKYIEQRLVDNQTELSPNVGKALEFERSVSGMTNWYSVLGDTDVAEVLRVALGIPESVAAADVDAQKKLFESKMDIKDLQDPEVQKSILQRYAAISDANDAAANINTNTAVMLLNAATNSGTYSIITLDAGLVSSFKGSYGF